MGAISYILHDLKWRSNDPGWMIGWGTSSLTWIRTFLLSCLVFCYKSSCKEQATASSVHTRLKDGDFCIIHGEIHSQQSIRIFRQRTISLTSVIGESQAEIISLVTWMHSIFNGCITVAENRTLLWLAFSCWSFLNCHFCWGIEDKCEFWGEGKGSRGKEKVVWREIAIIVSL